MQVDAGLTCRDFFSRAGSQAVEFHSLEMLQLLTMFKPLLQHKYVEYIFFAARCVAFFFFSGILQMEKRP